MVIDEQLHATVAAATRTDRNALGALLDLVVDPQHRATVADMLSQLLVATVAATVAAVESDDAGDDDQIWQRRRPPTVPLL